MIIDQREQAHMSGRRSNRMDSGWIPASSTSPRSEISTMSPAPSGKYRNQSNKVRKIIVDVKVAHNLAES